MLANFDNVAFGYDGNFIFSGVSFSINEANAWG